MRKLLVAVLMLFALTACSSGTSTTLSPSQFDELTKQAGVVTLDVRTPGEFASGHLPNAVNMDVESATFAQQVSELDPNTTYAVYCRSGNRSKTAMQQMSDAGIDNAQDLDGGIVAWEAQGLPVVQ
ncbi:MAG: rhodanese-like domain-containing protein [Candidatus Nanopelagicales bacterium]|jgi:rhodanese-related sulfurtransferase